MVWQEEQQRTSSFAGETRLARPASPTLGIPPSLTHIRSWRLQITGEARETVKTLNTLALVLFHALANQDHYI